MSNIYFDETAFEDFCNWSKYDKQIFNKLVELIKHCCREPYKGIGKPEPLKFDKHGYWSRRINDEHRLVYKVDEHGDIFIASCKGHY